MYVYNLAETRYFAVTGHHTAALVGTYATMQLAKDAARVHALKNLYQCSLNGKTLQSGNELIVALHDDPEGLSRSLTIIKREVIGYTTTIESPSAYARLKRVAESGPEIDTEELES